MWEVKYVKTLKEGESHFNKVCLSELSGPQLPGDKVFSSWRGEDTFQIEVLSLAFKGRSECRFLYLLFRCL